MRQWNLLFFWELLQSKRLGSRRAGKGENECRMAKANGLWGWKP